MELGNFLGSSFNLDPVSRLAIFFFERFTELLKHVVCSLRPKYILKLLFGEFKGLSLAVTQEIIGLSESHAKTVSQDRVDVLVKLVYLVCVGLFDLLG